MGKKYDLIGKKFHKLTVESKIGSIYYHGKYVMMWKCRCECGGENEISTSRINREVVKSCGNCIKKQEKFTTKELGAKKAFRKSYSDGDLELEQFIELSQMNCSYCGDLPKNCTEYIGNKKLNDGDFVYNGLDRIDSSKKHTLDNIIPCCKKCNEQKSDATTEDFLNRNKRIYDKFK